MAQSLLEQTEFADNPEPRCAVVLALDTSWSMSGSKFVTADQFQPPVLNAGGGTPMGQAVQQALALLRERKETYKRNGVDYFRPWLFLMTDGEPTDTWEPAAEQARQEETRKGVSVYGVGVEGANLQTLARFCPPERPPLLLRGVGDPRAGGRRPGGDLPGLRRNVFERGRRPADF